MMDNIAGCWRIDKLGAALERLGRLSRFERAIALLSRPRSLLPSRGETLKRLGGCELVVRVCGRWLRPWAQLCGIRLRMKLRPTGDGRYLIVRGDFYLLGAAPKWFL